MERRIKHPGRYENAPTDVDLLAAELGGFACYSQMFCRFSRPWKDFHHFNFPASEFPDGQPPEGQKMCRCKHEVIHAEWYRSEDV